MIGRSKKCSIFLILLCVKLSLSNLPLISDAKVWKHDLRSVVVSLHDWVTRKHFCTGSIVGARWVLTSATCLHKKEARHVSVIGGSTSLKSNGSAYAVDSFVFSPYFEEGKVTNNLALVKTRMKFRFKRDLRLALLANISEEGASGSVMGWRKGSTDLFVGQVSTISYSKCFNRKKGVERASPGLMCVEAKTSSYNLGEGMPMFHEEKLVGVYSYTAKEGGKENFYAFTKVMYFKDWLYELIYYCGC